jgi:hypothetical protein
MIGRPGVILRLCRALQADYVALLGQSGVGITTLIQAIVNDPPPIRGMQFLSVSPSYALGDTNAFKTMFLRRLIHAAARIPPPHELADRMQRVIDECGGCVDLRLEAALETLGLCAGCDWLVIVLHELAEVPHEPLKSLLQTLREYHNQRYNRGTAGGKLRFLVAGNERLWTLCCHKSADRSPFNIAQRVFLDGLSCQELQGIDQFRRFETAARLRDLTDGIPELVVKGLEGGWRGDGLFPFFEPLEDRWNSLPIATQQTLKDLIESGGMFPRCHNVDSECPAIPKLASPWAEAFWKGFVRLRHDELSWRSPIHRAFVMKEARVVDDRSRAELVKRCLLDRVQALRRAKERVRDLSRWDEGLDDVRTLAVQAGSVELVPVLELIRHGTDGLAIFEILEQTARSTDKRWIREAWLGAVIRRQPVVGLLIDAVLAGAEQHPFDDIDDAGAQASVQEESMMAADAVVFDVFLCHNSRDKPAVKGIGEQLRDRGLNPWLDEWHLRPGDVWIDHLDVILRRVRTAAVFVGPNGTGPWEKMEIRALLKRFVNTGIRVIPVLLKGAESEPNWSIFLDDFHRVDFRITDPDPLEQLMWGITGERSKSTTGSTVKTPSVPGTAARISPILPAKRKVLEERIARLTAEYEAVNAQIDQTLEEGSRLRLKGRAEALEREIEEQDGKLRALG